MPHFTCGIWMRAVTAAIDNLIYVVHRADCPAINRSAALELLSGSRRLRGED
jgi:hypothetical protein